MDRPPPARLTSPDVTSPNENRIRRALTNCSKGEATG
ncbi:hypothetical protein Ae168Ps1_2450 [Pseudonocardia sp. Ae168_Ps1]|nr:hypothetical protein Ae150APs1_2445 [Pseudonocardia sp. Ae150A_Ps1]OLL80044.1 hypothetical protein Ae168Ps1_2450 [Pseudonocardia sp. Ae168_Ps1]OLL85824.1 hypothetical protein Ae263Ps1_2879c [Pseudonocardia sp. Ae263_Ps1]